MGPADFTLFIRFRLTPVSVFLFFVLRWCDHLCHTCTHYTILGLRCHTVHIACPSPTHLPLHCTLPADLFLGLLVHHPHLHHTTCYTPSSLLTHFICSAWIVVVLYVLRFVLLFIHSVAFVVVFWALLLCICIHFCILGVLLFCLLSMHFCDLFTCSIQRAWALWYGGSAPLLMGFQVYTEHGSHPPLPVLLHCLLLFWGWGVLYIFFGSSFLWVLFGGLFLFVLHFVAVLAVLLCSICSALFYILTPVPTVHWWLLEHFMAQCHCCTTFLGWCIYHTWARACIPLHTFVVFSLPATPTFLFCSHCYILCWPCCCFHWLHLLIPVILTHQVHFRHDGRLVHCCCCWYRHFLLEYICSCFLWGRHLADHFLPHFPTSWKATCSRALYISAFPGALPDLLLRLLLMTYSPDPTFST